MTEIERLFRIYYQVRPNQDGALFRAFKLGYECGYIAKMGELKKEGILEGRAEMARELSDFMTDVASQTTKECNECKS